MHDPFLIKKEIKVPKYTSMKPLVYVSLSIYLIVYYPASLLQCFLYKRSWKEKQKFCEHDSTFNFFH